MTNSPVLAVGSCCHCHPLVGEEHTKAIRSSVQVVSSPMKSDKERPNGERYSVMTSSDVSAAGHTLILDKQVVAGVVEENRLTNLSWYLKVTC
jgi:hypothetical protein